MYQLFYDGEEPPALPKPSPVNGDQWGTSGRAGRYLFKLRKALAQMKPEDRTLLFSVTQRVASRKR